MVDPRGMPTMLAASVNVPEAYVVELLRAGDPAGGRRRAREPDAEQVATRFDDIRAQIEQLVKPHLKTRGESNALVEGEVQVAMVPTKVLAGRARPRGAAACSG
jgi:hypothetical protein